MPLDLNQPANRKVLSYIKRLGAKEWVGVHPDVGDHFARLAAQLIGGVRRSIRGVRIIAHRKTGTIVAIAFGTTYCVRVGSAVKEARQARLRVSEEFMDGGKLNVQRTFGPDWFYGAWCAKERGWIQAVLTAEETEDT
jgi:hypothetical protein